VNETLVNWPQSPERLRHFHDHLIIHHNIQFTMKKATFLSWTKIFAGETMALWAIRYTINLPIPTST
jgi:hypothetical protein